MGLWLWFLWFSVGYCCEIQLISSPNYRSIVSLKNILKNSDVEVDQITLLISKDVKAFSLENWQIMTALIPYYGQYYAYLFSISSNFPLSYNPSTMVGVDSFQEDPLDASRDIMTMPHTLSTLFYTIASTNIYNGTELTRPYLDHHATSRYSTKTISNDLSKLDYGKIQKYCLSNIEIRPSTIPKAGKGVFTKKSFQKGEIITISPVYILPRHEVIKTIGTSVLMNYCIVSNESDVALLPATQIAMVNHGGKSSNIQLSWASTSSTITMLSWNPKDLENEYFPPLDMIYIATRDIAAGEELMIDYGRAWENQWREYITNLEKWVENEYANGLVILNKPQFRSFIAAPGGLFPSHWSDVCIGSTPCETNEQLQLLKDQFREEIETAISFMKHISTEEREEVIVEATAS